MSHQLRAVLAKPNVDTVVAALRDDTAAGAGLFRIAAGFGSTSVRVDVAVNGRPHVFPAPERVPALLELLFARLDTMFQLSTRPNVDVDIAAFAIWGLTAIHPFDNANGRPSRSSCSPNAGRCRRCRWSCPKTPTPVWRP